jgi:hypothetical protein
LRPDVASAHEASPKKAASTSTASAAITFGAARSAPRMARSGNESGSDPCAAGTGAAAASAGAGAEVSRAWAGTGPQEGGHCDVIE